MLREESDFIHCNNLMTKETPVTGKRTETNPGNDTWKILPSILFQLFYRWPQQYISCLIVPEMTLEMCVTSNSIAIALQTTSAK